jgi:hypothetical protein
MPATVETPTQSANTNTRARTVNSLDTENTTAQNKSWQTILGARPKYLRYNLWSPESYLSPTVADWSETADPLPRPPPHVLDDPNATQTILNNPDLFKIVTPINVDEFERLLSDHPNPEFVDSVCTGLREGFWPWADTTKPDYPVTYDLAKTPKNEAEAKFIREQCDAEIQKERFSRAFGKDLLPGMYCMPVHAVPKKDTTDLRMVTDHSAGQYSLNSMIDHERVTGYPLDNMRHLGEMLLHFVQRSIDHKTIVMWKSDVSEAYRRMPVHPYWQIKQANAVDGNHYIDRCNAFGTSSSGAIWISFNSLVAWIARHRLGFDYLATYVDDSSGFDVKGDTLFYEPYQLELPYHQTLLLHLWDDLGIPHKSSKQVSNDEKLTIIGIVVNPNTMTFSLPAKSKADLLEALTAWHTRPLNGSKQSYQLKYWQQMAGWVNWAFNVYPLLRPCLNRFYPKFAGIYNPTRKIHVNNDVREDLAWAANHIRHSNGIFLLRATDWDPSLADFTIYCDASLTGMGFWYPELQLGFHSSNPESATNIIFFFEALAVFCALKDVTHHAHQGARVVIYTDNLNTVQIFNSLKCLDKFNIILKACVDILLETDIDLRVLHVPGTENIVADALSRFQFQTALNIVPDLKITSFQPPLWSLGAAKK